MRKTTRRIPYEETKAEIQKNLGGIDTYPFCNIQEWGLAKWLGTSGLPQTQIDNFLNLPWVNVFAPTFKSAKQLISWIEQLPAQGAPAWKGAWITLPEAPKDPQLLLYRDPLECLEWLEGNPEFTKDKEYVPYEEYMDEAHTERCYSEMASGEAWNNIQHEFPEHDGITVNPVILTSDSTHLTNFSGDKKVKPLLISSGHIKQHVRAAPSRQAFLCTAFIPEGKFPNLEFGNVKQAKELPGVLNRRLHHISLRHILQTLVPHETIPKEMLDSEGFLRREIIRIVAYIADLPEQALNAALAPNQCVACLSGTKQFGSPSSCACHTGASILAAIAEIKAEHPNVSAYKFNLEAKTKGLNGVDEPWWKDFKHLEICDIICPDVLHGLHKALKITLSIGISI
ncbi:hypothetical protein M422DRAFT_162676 [Sphaerobolus stellatus SS14]|nr:hypothetical protein M422DRAFT_162676 [Sphaerobolus stellatus SS14]